MIKCIVFDIQGVIFQTGSQVRHKLIDEGFDETNLKLIGGDGDIGKIYLDGKISYEEYVERVKTLFPDSYEYVLHEYFSDYMTLSFSNTFWSRIVRDYSLSFPIDNFKSASDILVLEIIKGLSINYPLAILSGNMRERIYDIDERFHYLQFFKYQIFSYDVGVNKPDKKIYEALLEKIPFAPQECLYFDDSKLNIDSAKTFGINAVQIDEIAHK